MEFKHNKGQLKLIYLRIQVKNKIKLIIFEVIFINRVNNKLTGPIRNNIGTRVTEQMDSYDIDQ